MSVRSWGLLAMISLLGCGNPVNPPEPKWTAENPNASSSAKSTAASAQKPVAENKADKSGGGSLDDLQKGGTAATGPLKDVFFAFDRSDLSPDARSILKANSDWLKANPAAQVQIEGHCDERGTVEYNLALGSKRAQASKDYLETLGIPANRLSMISYGEEIPVCRENNDSCWEKNRRARFIVTSGRPAS
ncbi:MAG TPA: peptidoglycan-associated lipoprotein Pal [Candidatus Binatia bacterium]